MSKQKDIVQAKRFFGCFLLVFGCYALWNYFAGKPLIFHKKYYFVGETWQYLILGIVTIAGGIWCIVSSFFGSTH